MKIYIITNQAEISGFMLKEKEHGLLQVDLQCNRHSCLQIKDDVKLTAGIMWHEIERKSDEFGLSAKITSFVPSTDDKVELTKIVITNNTEEK